MPSANSALEVAESVGKKLMYVACVCLHHCTLSYLWLGCSRIMGLNICPILLHQALSGHTLSD